jgi:8-oxo-dGTP diphosphatase
MSLDATQNEYYLSMPQRQRAAGARALDADERAFLAAYDPRAFPPTAVTVDIAILTVQQGQLCVLLVRRAGHPYRDRWALPGGFVREREDLDDAARRELAEETGVTTSAHLEQLRCYGAPDRDPRMRVVSVAYLALVPDQPRPAAGSDAADARFWPVADVLADGEPGLAFDHGRILADAVDRARAKLEYTSLATTFLPEPFTIADLRRVYEAVWGVELHAANFRRKVLSTPDLVVGTGDERPTGRGWAELYRRGATTQLHPPILRPNSLAAGEEVAPRRGQGG